MKRTNFSDRVFTTALLVPTGLLLLLYGHWSLYMLMALLGAIMWYEWNHMVEGMLHHHAIATKEAGRWHAFGVVYITLPLLALLYLSIYTPRIYVVWAVLVVMGTDIGAYVIGKKLQGKKLASKISPQKTQSGAIGGLLAALLVTWCMSSYFVAPQWQLLLVAALWSGIAQVGDLLESWVKRQAKLKDSGVLLPGHGGVLDRFDGYMTTLPMAALIAAVFPQLTVLF